MNISRPLPIPSPSPLNCIRLLFHGVKIFSHPFQDKRFSFSLHSLFSPYWLIFILLLCYFWSLYSMLRTSLGCILMIKDRRITSLLETLNTWVGLVDYGLNCWVISLSLWSEQLMSICLGFSFRLISFPRKIFPIFCWDGKALVFRVLGMQWEAPWILSIHANINILLV